MPLGEGLPPMLGTTALNQNEPVGLDDFILTVFTDIFTFLLFTNGIKHGL